MVYLKIGRAAFGDAKKGGALEKRKNLTQQVVCSSMTQASSLVDEWVSSGIAMDFDLSFLFKPLRISLV